MKPVHKKPRIEFVFRSHRTDVTDDVCVLIKNNDYILSCGHSALGKEYTPLGNALEPVLPRNFL